MSRESTLVLLGALVVLSPFSGLPLSWLMWALPVLGLAIAGIGFSLRLKKQGEREVHLSNETQTAA